MNEIIRITDLSKSFGGVKAVDNLSFKVKRGELFAFLGVNGAGKSTTISVMCGLLSADSGEIEIDGVKTDGNNGNMRELKSRLGVVFQNSVLDKALSVRDNLESRAALYGIFGAAFKKRLCELSELLDFSELLPRQVGRLSGGERRRIDIARALLSDPAILVLDEPTTGLDPQTRKLLWDVTARLRAERGMTVFLTTHYMEEAAEADYVVIIDGGRTAAEGTPLELKNRYSADYITLYGADESEVKKLGRPYETLKNAFRLSVTDTAEATRMIIANPSVFTDYEIAKGRMDDVFLAVTGKRLVGGEAQ